MSVRVSGKEKHQVVIIEAISEFGPHEPDQGAADVLACLRTGVSVGTLLATADGPKRVEDLRPGDQLLTHPRDDPRRN